MNPIILLSSFFYINIYIYIFCWLNFLTACHVTYPFCYSSDLAGGREWIHTYIYIYIYIHSHTHYYYFFFFLFQFSSNSDHKLIQKKNSTGISSIMHKSKVVSCFTFYLYIDWLLSIIHLSTNKCCHTYVDRRLVSLV